MEFVLVLEKTQPTGNIKNMGESLFKAHATLA